MGPSATVCRPEPSLPGAGVATVLADIPLPRATAESCSSFGVLGPRSWESWISELREQVVAAEQRGEDGASALASIVRAMVVQGTSTPAMLKAYSMVSRQTRAAKLASALLREDELARHARAAQAAEELLREEALEAKRARSPPSKKDRRRPER